MFALFLCTSSLGIPVCRAQVTATAPGLSAELTQPFASLPDAPSSLLALATPPQETQPAGPPQASDSAVPPAPPSETEAERRARERLEAEAELKKEEAQRILGVVPNFNVVIGGQAVPLTAGQKWKLAYHSSVDPFYFATAFLLAGYSEIDDTHQGYHWGPKGYFKRAGANYADTVNGTLIGNALLPVLLKQDPRYFRKGTGSIKSRIVYSALTTFICRGDNGHKQFNLSNVAGNFISGAISNTYYPSDEVGLELTLTNASVVTLEGSLGAMFEEFAPDVINHFRHRHDK